MENAVEEILLVEDDPQDRELTLHVIRKAGMAGPVALAKTGEEALERLRRIPAGAIRLVLLDLRLPGMSGLQVLQAIRQSPDLRYPAIVILTSSRNEPDLLQSFAMGATDYVIKPLDPESFARMYRHFVRLGP